jgi:hypothetical protein
VRPAARLGAFALVLAAASGGGAVVGAAVGDGADEAPESPTGTSVETTDGHSSGEHDAPDPASGGGHAPDGRSEPATGVPRS